MYFNNYGKEISSKIKPHNRIVLRNIIRIHIAAINNTRTEIQYFRYFFPALQTYLNGLRISGTTFNCKTKEIHSTPLVTYGVGQTCELGDYFIVVKYKHNNTLIGRKIIIYQLKRTHNKSWLITQKQLMLLKDWHTFSFGRRFNTKNSFNLRPTRPEYGSFVLINDLKLGLRISNIFGTAYDIFQNQNANKVHVSDESKYCYSGLSSYFKLLTWEIGEPIVQNTDISDFTSALYRYIGWEEDPPEEFIKFEKKGEQNSFWGIEITVNSESNG